MLISHKNGADVMPLSVKELEDAKIKLQKQG